MAKNHYISGSWNLTCDRCGKKIKAEEAKQEWTGFIVCHEDWEPRHEQDFVRARSDKITVPFQRPIPPLIFTNVVYGNMYVDTGWVIFGYYEGNEL